MCWCFQWDFLISRGIWLGKKQFHSLPWAARIPVSSLLPMLFMDPTRPLLMMFWPRLSRWTKLQLIIFKHSSRWVEAIWRRECLSPFVLQLYVCYIDMYNCTSSYILRLHFRNRNTSVGNVFIKHIDRLILDPPPSHFLSQLSHMLGWIISSARRSKLAN